MPLTLGLSLFRGQFGWPGPERIIQFSNRVGSVSSYGDILRLFWDSVAGQAQKG